MRSRISIRGCVRPLVHPSVGPSVRPSVGRSHTSWISGKWAEFEQNIIGNKIVCHLKDDSKKSTWAVRQKTHLLSEFCSTYFSTPPLSPLLFSGRCTGWNLFPMSSKASERMNEWAECKGKVRSIEQANEWAVRANERVDELRAKFSMRLFLSRFTFFEF